MVLILLIGLICFGTAAALALRAFVLGRGGAVRQLDQIQGYGFGAVAEPDLSPIPRRRSLDETATRIGRIVAKHLGSFREDEVQDQLTKAGLYRTSPMAFLGYRVLATIVTPLLFVWLATIGGTSSFLVVIGTLLALVVGWTLPMTFLRRRTQARFNQIEFALPELVDLLVLTVEAGIGFNGSLQLAAARSSGPLGDELRLTLQEESLGLSLNAALTNMLSRADTPSMRSFVRSVLQGETLGVSIGAIMRNLAAEMRKRRRQHAEERAQRAPVKILFPLVFLIFPPLFIVLLYPAFHAFGQAFGHG